MPSITDETLLISDALPLADLLKFDGVNFRDRQTNEVISAKDVVDLYGWYLDEVKSKFKAAGRKVFENPSNLTHQLETKRLLKEIHVTNAAIGNQGLKGLTDRDFLDVANILKSQYGLTDNNPKPYGLKYLFKDIQEGKVTEGRLDTRLEMYAKGGEVSRDTVKRNAEIRSGKTEAKRIYGNTHVHCDDCIRYNSLGWTPIYELIIPKTKCQCYTNCKCTVTYR